jgi:microcin C transport system substrate-binding protein
LQWENGSDLPELGSPEARKGGVHRGRMQDFPRTLRPYGPDATGGQRAYLLDDVAIRFAQLHPDVEGPHQFYPGLAREWAVDRESRTVFMRLDPAARWSDGHPVTADDLFFMFYFFQSRYINEPWYNNWYGIGENYMQVTRFDDRTVAISMKEVRPDMLSRAVSLVPLPRHAYRDFGPDYVQRYQWRVPPTTGAYTILPEELARIRTNRSGLTFSRVKDWWAADKRHFRYRFNTDEIQLRVIRDTPKAFESALAADLDFIGGMGLAEYWYDQLPNNHPLVERGLIHKTTFYNDVPRPTYGLWMNSARPLLNNQDIRVGIHYASNWQLVIDQYFRGDYARMNTTSDGYGDMTHPGIRARPFDLQRAAQHFAAAGFTRRGPDGVLMNERGERLSFNLSSGYEALAPVLNILRQEALRAGLEFRVEILDGSAAWKKVQEKNHDIAFTAFGVSVEQFPRYWETYHSVNAFDQAFLEDGVTPNPERRTKPQTNNLQSIAIPELDQLITLYDRSEDLDEMRQLAFRMEEILHEDASFCPGFVTPFYRTAYWRWVRYPENFNARLSRDPQEYFLHWIDEDKRSETMRARRGSETFPPAIRVFDQWRAPVEESGT